MKTVFKSYHIIIFFVTLFITKNAEAQVIRDLVNHDTMVYIYSLSDEQIRYINSESKIVDTPWLFTHEYKQISENKFDKYALEYGNYIIARFRENGIYIENFSKVPFTFSFKQIRNQTLLYLSDELKHTLITKAKVIYKNKESVYDEGYGAYPFNYVQPKLANELNTLDVEYNQKHYIIRLNSTTQNNHIQESYKPNTTNPMSPGYLILTKPKYKLLDTLKCKAFLVNHFNGNPINDKVWMEIKDDHKTIFSAYIKPITEGAYVYNWVIPDSLKSDKQYAIHLSYTKRGYNFRIQKSFVIEDYQLDKNTYEFFLPKDSFIHGENVSVLAQAKDANGFLLSDARIKMTMSIEQIINTYTDTIIFNDSQKNNWYSIDTLLNENNISEFIIPQHKLLNALVKYKLTATILDASLEKQEFVKYFYWDATKTKLNFNQSDDSIYVEYLSSLQQAKEKFTVIMLRNASDTLKKISIETPYAIQIPFNAKQALLYKKDTLIKSINLYHDFISSLNIKGARTMDSIFISFQNILEAPVHYKIYKDNDIIESGVKQQLTFKKMDNSKATYYLLVNSNENQNINNNAHLFAFKHREHKLTITSNLPNEIYPGQEIPLEIDIKDYYNKVVQGANITALGINAMFKNQLQKPSVYIPRKQPQEIEEEALTQNVEYLISGTLLEKNISGKIKKWHLDKFNLYKNDYYKIIYPKAFFNVITFPLNNNKCEAAVVPIQNGLPYYPIYIKVDGVVVYFQQANNKLPYSFNVKPGKHNIEVRFLDKLIQLQDVICTAHAKNIISFANDSLQSTSYKKNSIKDSLPIFSLKAEEFKEMSKSYVFFSHPGLDTLILSSYSNNANRINYFSPYNIGTTMIDGDAFWMAGPISDSKAIMAFKEKKSIVDISKPILYYFDYKNDLVKELKWDNNITQSITANSSMPLQVLIDTFLQIEKKVEEIHEEKAVPIRSKIPEPKTYLHSFTNNYAVELTNRYVVNFYFYLPDTTHLINCWLIDKTISEQSVFYNAENQPSNKISFIVTNHVYDVVLLYNTGAMFKVSNYQFQPYENWHINAKYVTPLQVNDSLIQDYIYLYNSLTKEAQQVFLNFPDESNVSPLYIKTKKRNSPLLKGVMLNDSGERLNDIELFLEKDGKFLAGAKTNAIGEFEFLNIPFGQYMLKIYDNNYTPRYIYNVLVDKNMEYFYTLTLENNNNLKPYFQINTIYARILAFAKSKDRQTNEAIILDRETREPLNNVEVSFWYDNNVIYKTYTNAKGKFDMFTTDHPLYLYTMHIELPNYKKIVASNIRFDESSAYQVVFFVKTQGAFDTATEYIDANMIQSEEEVNYSVGYNDEGEYKNKQGSAGIEGKIVDEKSMPIDGAIIKIFRNGQMIRTTRSDIKGEYLLEGIEPGLYDLHAKFIGYTEFIVEEVKVIGSKIKIENITMNIRSSNKSLKEVVITTSKRKLIDVDNRNVVYSKSNSSVGSSSYKLLPTVALGDQTALAESVYQQKSDMASISIGGSRIDNTVYTLDGIPMRGSIIKKFETLSKEKSNALFDKIMFASDATSIRENFNDVGFWVPNLITNKNGKAYTSLKIPDNVTSWQCFIVAMSNQFRYDILAHRIRSYKPILTTSIVPRFLYKDDELMAKVKFTNLDNSLRNIKVDIHTDDNNLLSKNVNIKKSYIDSVLIKANTNKDTLVWKAQLDFDAKYIDGEKMKIPIYSTTLTTVDYNVLLLDKDSSYAINIPTNTHSTIYFNNKIYETILSHIETLKNYPFGCTEQNCSKLKALLLEKSIKSMLKQTFHSEKMIRKYIKQIEKSQHFDGSYGWWQGGNANVRMTCYVAEILQLASTYNYTSSSLLYCTQFLKNNLHAMSKSDKLYAWYVLKLTNTQLVFPDEFNQIDFQQLPAHDKLYYLLCKKYFSNEVPMQLYYSWVLENRELCKVAYTENFFYDPSANLFMSYLIFKNTPYEKVMLENVKPWLQNPTIWQRSNTYTKAYLLDAWLYAATKDSNEKVNATLTINDTLKIQTYPYTLKATTGRYTIQHKGAKVYTTIVNQIEIENPQKTDSLFSIESSFKQNSIATTNLLLNTKTTLDVKVYAFKTKQQVMIEIPIPSGCSYESKPTATGDQEFIEYNKNKVIVYYNVLSKGEHYISIPLNTIFAGTCNVPAIKASLMYYPYMSGNNENKKIEIK